VNFELPVGDCCFATSVFDICTQRTHVRCLTISDYKCKHIWVTLDNRPLTSLSLSKKYALSCKTHLLALKHERTDQNAG
jgi:hypothetical protein